MCGFAGLLSRPGRSEETLHDDVRRMSAVLAHRGPDDDGIWTDAECGVALGFRRLAILDLSAQGHQPMTSATGRYVILFNGEVYNYAALRAELAREDARFRGRSDTEVVLAAIERWGLAVAVTRFVGMFAFALWDRTTRELSLVRDRLGIKPLFVYSEPGFVSFGSELKALVAGPSFDRTVDPEALVDFLRYLYVPGPRTIYRRARKLPPGHVLTISDPTEPLPAAVPFWSAERAAEAGCAEPFEGSDEEAEQALEELLAECISQHMVADVPLGALLSGGVDSTLVAALMQRTSARPVKTFSIAFEEREYDEAAHAARVATHIGTDHTRILLTGRDALDVVPRLPDVFDEPHADTSQIPALLVCSVARREVTVALSGDGGDEIFGGYNRYTYGERLLPRMLDVPRPARRLVAAGIGGISAASWDRAHRVFAPVMPQGMRQRLPGDKLHKIGRLLGSDSVVDMYRSLVSAWQHPEQVVEHSNGGTGTLERVMGRQDVQPLLHRMMLTDQLTYLVDDQLAKVDRVSMAVGLEVRVPLLDHRLVELAWRLRPALKVRGGSGKWLLRRVLYRHVPREIVERPKQGLSVPIDQWLRGPLREWAEDLLAPGPMAAAGMLRPEPVQAAWRALVGGHGQGALGIWAVLMFQAWHRRWAS